MSELYKFEKLDSKLTEWGFPVIDGKSGFQPIRVDFNADNFRKAVKEGKVRFGQDGIYLMHEGVEWKGYMYMPTYRVIEYGMPRFHLTRCEKIEELFSSGYSSYYKWSNNKLNDITDRNLTHKVYPNQRLQLCNYCRNKITEISNTEDFFETLDTKENANTSIEVDIFGYVKNWQKISKDYRKSKDYTCESCGIKPARNFDKRFWHTHHKNGDKTKNEPSNLECLCVLCHSHKDHTHEENFDKTRMKIELNSFIKQYGEELRKI